MCVNRPVLGGTMKWWWAVNYPCCLIITIVILLDNSSLYRLNVLLDTYYLHRQLISDILHRDISYLIFWGEPERCPSLVGAMLVDHQPSLISHVRRQYDKIGKQVFEDVNAWGALSEILSDILEDPLL
jgi:hypothetical protein